MTWRGKDKFVAVYQECALINSVPCAVVARSQNVIIYFACKQTFVPLGLAWRISQSKSSYKCNEVSKQCYPFISSVAAYRKLNNVFRL